MQEEKTQAGPEGSTSEAWSTHVARALLEDARECEREQAELTELASRCDRAQACREALVRAVGGIYLGFQIILIDQRADEAALPLQMKAVLLGRREGLDLCLRMLERAKTRIEQEANAPPPARRALAPSLGEADIMAVAGGVETGRHDAPRSALRDFLKRRRIRNHRVVAEQRGRAEALERSIATAVTKLLLPVLDGIEAGARLARTLAAELSEPHPDARTLLDRWLGAYDRLIVSARSALGAVGIHPIVCLRGERVEYERHEPTDVESDAELADETIKEVTRTGYVLQVGAQAQVLRPAQVVVVKNTPGTA